MGVMGNPWTFLMDLWWAHAWVIPICLYHVSSLTPSQIYWVINSGLLKFGFATEFVEVVFNIDVEATNVVCLFIFFLFSRVNFCLLICLIFFVCLFLFCIFNSQVILISFSFFYLGFSYATWQSISHLGGTKIIFFIIVVSYISIFHSLQPWLFWYKSTVKYINFYN